MNKFNIEPINQERIKIDVEDIPQGLQIKLHGDIDMEDPSILLDPFFSKIHEGITSKKMKEVVADFRGLNFLNSSGIKAVAKWIMKLTDLADDKKYLIKILHNKDITWQVTSLPTLTFLVPGGVKIE
ncbi:MAG: hypothetical protein EHM28_10135 [Spirochaetaceae bacterium]|nr:MAG: hypothetical protein EHM28_10135 [Spirochaetaceae bacterium]